MPRDGSFTYIRPFPDVEEDTTIESAVYNGFTADIATDLNAPRPILSGGTAATNARDARINLGTETAQAVVTNYDSHVWQAGSFYSSATPGQNAPVDGHAFMGIVYMVDANNIVVEARDQNDTVVPGRLYVREKKAGTWGTWKLDGRFNAAGGVDGISSETADMFYGVRGTAPASAFIVNTESDATGIDIISATKAGVITLKSLVANAVQVVLSAVAGKANQLIGSVAGSPRWSINLGDGTAESTGNVGNDFQIFRFDNAGAVLGTPPIAINRATGRVDISGSEVAIKSYVDSSIAALKAVPAGTVCLFYQGAAPLGYTKLVTQNDKALRVVSGTGGVAGGTNAFSTVMAQTATAAHTLTAAEIPSVTSTGLNAITVYPGGDPSYSVPIAPGTWASSGPVGGGGVPRDLNNTTQVTASFSANNNITVASSAGGGSHTHPITLAMQYIDIILASRDA